MDKKRIEEFAVSSRRQLIENLTYEANKIGITKEEIKHPDNVAEDMQTFTSSGIINTLYGKQIEQRQQLIKEIENHGFDNTIEKIAYTWFNRIIAIRFMEINNYLPTKTRVLSSITPGKKEPDILTEALNIDLDYTTEEKKQIYQLKEENNTDELFKLLFIKQCNKLNEILPELFETIDDYTELLFNIQLSNENNIINKLITSIPEEDFQNRVEIIGWLYQYYITDLNYLVYDGSFKRKKLEKELIPYATQIFTPDWVVKYMVDNSLGKLWITENPTSILSKKLNYYISDRISISKNSLDINNIEKLKIIDPCMGSGHILVYVFDVLIEIYISLGYTSKDASKIILEKNIYGLDIDDRAYQLAYFALMMKAREYNRKIFDFQIQPNIYSIKESNNISKNFLNDLKKYNQIIEKSIDNLINTFIDAKEYGSILKVNIDNIKEIEESLIRYKKTNNSTFYKYDINLFEEIINQSKTFSLKYDVVITNPPYLNRRRFNNKLLSYVNKNYPDVKTDLSIIMYESIVNNFSKINGYVSFITTNSWMYIKSFSKFRKKLINNYKFISLVDFGSELFEGKVGHNLIVSWIIRNTQPKKDNKATAIKLTDFNFSNRYLKEKEFFNLKNHYIFNQLDFNEIPNYIISYWMSKNLVEIFKKEKILSDISEVKQGLATADNNRFLRLWYEVDFNNIFFNCSSEEESKNSTMKWYSYNKGGNFRKWYGNHEYVINWMNNGLELKKFKKANIINPLFFFKKNISWSRISLGHFSFRYYPEGFLFDSASSSIFIEENFYYVLGLLNSCISQHILEIISPTLNNQSGTIATVPIIIPSEIGQINRLVEENIQISKEDWDENETSWNFKKHPLVEDKPLLKDNFIQYKEYKEKQFNSLKNNEIKLNELFSDIYNENSIDTNIEDKYISIRKANYVEDIKSFISYSVGCMFGRYNLDQEGLACSGREFDITIYSRFIPDEDNIIPIIDEEYFDDDIINRFIEFIKVTFGTETLDNNLEFISNALSKTNNTSKEVIRNYFINNFFEDHKKMYSVTMRKAPIYWMFDSGKQNAFKCLIYMHRYEPDLVSRIRFDYLHKTQRAIEENIKRQENIINNSQNKAHVKKANKEKTKLVKQLDEIKLYDLALAHVANERIEIDLDDGVKVNYAKFQNIEVIDPKTNKTKKINLLAKL